MPTNREIKAMLRPLLKRRPELVYHKRLLFIAPLTHYLRGVYFDQSGYFGRLRLAAVARPFFDGSHVPALGALGNEPPGFQERDSSFRDEPKNIVAIHEWLEHEALPRVEPIVDPRAQEKDPTFLVGLYPGGGKYEAVFRFAKALYHCFWGEYEAAKTWLAEQDEALPQYSSAAVQEHHKFDLYWGWRGAYLHKVLQTDPTRVPALLHEWEAFSAKAQDLEKYWRPTPFPCEL